MDTLAPPVVAVVVAHDPGPWFEETLASLCSQDYPELSVLVLDAAGGEGLTERVANVLPAAYVRRFEENRGFGSVVNEVPGMVDGADFFLLCHDDVALLPDAVHLMVEEAFRSNAGIVSPKEVSWDDPKRLVHVGMTVDKGGSVVDRVQPNEIDHGQHDAVRDVFLAPGGATLVRADLFAELGGFDPDIVAMGEDLDLCWRAQVAGARIIVAPDARVRHLETLAGGARPLETTLLGEQEDLHRPVTLQELQRRHELLAVLKCYSGSHLLRVLPQVAVLAFGEVVVATLTGDRARTRAVVRAWRWNLGRVGIIRRQRKEVAARRRLGDKEIRMLQVSGSARLSAWTRRLFHHGLQGVLADELAPDELGTPDELAPELEAGPVPSDRGAVSATAVSRPQTRLSPQVTMTAWVAATVIVLIGTRGVIGGRLPVVGQFTPFPSWGATLTAFATGWHPSGVGTTAPSSPALGLVGLAGTLLLGAMGLAQKVLILGCLPVGAWGASRLLRHLASSRACLVAGLAYLAMALPYNALSQGRWDALVVYAGAPWVLTRLFRAVRAGPPDTMAAASRWRGFRPVVALGLLEAVMVSFVPAAALVVVVSGVALLLSCLLFGNPAGGWRALRLALEATVVAGLICLPWVIGVLSAGHGAVAVFGVPAPASSAASWEELLRFAVGPIGVSPLAWGFAVAALVPLFLARGPRFVWAGRLWSIALLFWVLDWVIGRGWTGSLAVDPLVLLAPAAVSVAGAIGLGVAAFEEDLRSATFGWRQLLSVVGTGAFLLGAAPTLVSAVPGRWDLPVNDFSQSVTWMGPKAASGSFRVLWLGDSRVLNQGSWSAGDGLAYATSENGSPDARWLWSAPGPGPATELASAVDLAREGRTDRLGALLAPAGVRYVVVFSALAPEIEGEQSPTSYPVPADLAPALARQLDLDPVVSGTGITVYANSSWVPERALVPRQRPVTVTDGSSAWSLAHPAPGTPLVPTAVPALPGPTAARSYQGSLSPGTLLTAYAPAGRWNLVRGDGAPLARSSSFGWAGRYAVTRPDVVTLSFDGGILAPASFLYSLVAWLAVIVFLSWSGERVRRRRLGHHARSAKGEAGEQVIEGTGPGAEGTGARPDPSVESGAEVVA